LALFDAHDDEQAVAAGIFVETANPELPLTLALPFTIDAAAAARS
jgi:hypothetical protein